ncbi:MAG: Ppx/GppA family phosphatase [Alphaproteobacteria bacterium]|nr:Ppx/GppA family phosphatase [Alphaproteobacteria bacterium]
MPVAGESIYAALDLGTNNCRLLIAAGEPAAGAHLPPAFRVVDSFSRIVKLGEGVTATGTLSGEAMERTIAALKVCQKKLKRYDVARARFVATEACRRASNSDVFVERVHAETGLTLDIISNEEEARLAFLGCASLLSQGSHRAIVFDIGGGSTEFMWIDVTDHANAGGKHPRGIAAWLSIDCGVMNLADRFGGQAFADLAFDDMVAYVEKRIAPFDEANDIGDTLSGGRVQLLSTSGTVTTLAAIHLGLPRYDRSRIDGIRLAVSDLRETTRKLLAMRPSERFHHPCIGPDREDYILSGCAIFEAISNIWPAGEITIADRGVREGIIISLLQG